MGILLFESMPVKMTRRDPKRAMHAKREKERERERVTPLVDVPRATVFFATVTKTCLSQECLSPGPYTPIEPRKMRCVVICLHQASKRMKNTETKNAKIRIALTFKGSHWTTISTPVRIDFNCARHHQAPSSRPASPFDNQQRRLHQQLMTSSNIATLH